MFSPGHSGQVTLQRDANVVHGGWAYIVLYPLRFLLKEAMLLSRFSCVGLCATPIDGNPPASPVPGILQARTLEWVAISFSNEGK